MALAHALCLIIIEITTSKDALSIDYLWVTLHTEA
jgi:hypothetical protein